MTKREQKQERKQERKTLRKKADQELLKRRLREKHFSPHFVQKSRASKTRSGIKTAMYRTISWGETALLAWLLIPTFGVAVFATVDAVGNTAIYYLFERMWAHIELWADRKADRKAADKTKVTVD
jgi:uncharacterized membrane protein